MKIPPLPAGFATSRAVPSGEHWPAHGPFPELQREAEAWNQELARDEGEHLGSGPSSAHIAAARKVLNALAPTQTGLALVNRDLHRDNVLRSTREPWLVIDPKPIIAEREFALANRLPMFGGTEIEEAGSEVIDRLNALAATLGLDATRVRGWAFVRSVLWARDLRQLEPHFSRVAGLLWKSLPESSIEPQERPVARFES